MTTRPPGKLRAVGARGTGSPRWNGVGSYWDFSADRHELAEIPRLVNEP